MVTSNWLVAQSTNEYSGDSTQLTYLRSRFYASGDGRFLTRDTWMGDYNRPLSLNRWNYVGSNPIMRADPSGLLYITFDDGPHQNDIDILNILKVFGARANFFFHGKNVNPNNPQSREIVWRVTSEGHRLGNHAYDHFEMSTECWDDAVRSILDTDFYIKESLSYVKRMEPSRYFSLGTQTRSYIDGVIENGTGLFRPPGGDITAAQIWLLQSNYEGAPGPWHVIMWTVDPADWFIDDEGLASDIILDRIINGWCSNAIGCVARIFKPNRYGSLGVQSNSDNILLHSDSEPTVEILPELIEWVKDQGYTFDLLTPPWQR